jgi:hypothetical protein
MQPDAYMLQKAFPVAQVDGFGAGNQAFVDQFPPVAPQFGGEGNPAE